MTNHLSNEPPTGAIVEGDDGARWHHIRSRWICETDAAFGEWTWPQLVREYKGELIVLYLPATVA